MPTMIVTDQDDGDVGKHHVAVIGQREQWTIGSPRLTVPVTPVTGLTLRFNPPDAAVGGYKLTDAKATTSPVAPLQKSAVFYWTRAGAVTVTLTAMVGPRVVSHIIEVQVLAPTVSEYTGSTHESTIKRYVPPGRAAHAADEEISMLKFGTDSVAGIRFDVTISMPVRLNCDGKVAMLQTLKVDRKKTLINGTEEHVQSGEFVIDQEVKYGLTHKGVKRKSLDTPNGQSVFTSDDSPGTTLGTSGARRIYSRVEVDEQYRMYIMYRPEHGIWVAVGLVEWRWSACAVYDAVDACWKLQPVADSGDKRIIAKKALFGRLPTWSRNVGDRDLLEPDH